MLSSQPLPWSSAHFAPRSPSWRAPLPVPCFVVTCSSCSSSQQFKRVRMRCLNVALAELSRVNVAAPRGTPTGNSLVGQFLDQQGVLFEERWTRGGSRGSLRIQPGEAVQLDLCGIRKRSGPSFQDGVPISDGWGTCAVEELGGTRGRFGIRDVVSFFHRWIHHTWGHPTASTSEADECLPMPREASRANGDAQRSYPLVLLGHSLESNTRGKGWRRIKCCGRHRHVSIVLFIHYHFIQTSRMDEMPATRHILGPMAGGQALRTTACPQAVFDFIFPLNIRWAS